MKTIELKSDAEAAWSDKEMLLIIADRPKGGNEPITPSEMRKNGRLIDALEDLAADATELTLEDADFQHLYAKVQAFPFMTSRRELRAMIDRFDEVYKAK